MRFSLWILLVLFASISTVALACSIWIFDSSVHTLAKWNEGDATGAGASVIIRGPSGPPGKRGPTGRHGLSDHFSAIHHWNIPWESEKRGAFLQFEADVHGFYCVESEFGQITVTGDMQVKNPPNGRNKILRSVTLWIPHEFFGDRHDGEDAWQIGSNSRRKYTGWRSSDTIGPVTHDDQEDFEVICNGFDDLDDFDSAEDFDRRRDHERDLGFDEVVRHREPNWKREAITFNIIVTTGDEQVGLTPFETVLPLHPRHCVRRCIK